MDLSIVLPARNEAPALAGLLPELKAAFPAAEILVVDDGSTDATRALCEGAGVRVVTHPYAKGNGAAVKTGVTAARGEVIALMDADGQHRPDDVARLVARYAEGFHMVVGARSHGSHANLPRMLVNRAYNTLASWMVGHRVPDLTSGLRVVNAGKFRQFLHLLPNGFSYPTTITMAFFRAGYSVGYEPIDAAARIGRSHINPLRDGVRFLLIIFRIGTLYSPLKLFLPFALFNFLIGLGYYAYTYATAGRFSLMSALLFIAAMLVFLIGLVSEQITILIYQRTQDR